MKKIITLRGDFFSETDIDDVCAAPQIVVRPQESQWLQMFVLLVFLLFVAAPALGIFLGWLLSR